MILTNKKPQQGDYLVAQNSKTYECLVFSETGEPYDYDTDHEEFVGYGRFKPMDSRLPATELDLRMDFFSTILRSELRREKDIRDTGKLAELNGFDFDAAAQRNIEGTINSFTAVKDAAISLGHPDDGTVPWILANNTSTPITLAELKALRDAGAARALILHVTYNMRRAELEALVPIPEIV